MNAFELEYQYVKTPEFDGPLELLLYLARKESVDLCNLAIAPITDAYLQHIATLELFDLDAAGEFLWMASTLCYLKSCELVPDLKRQAHDETEDLDPEVIKEKLKAQLIQYERLQLASFKLNELNILNRDVFLRSSSVQKENCVNT